MALQDLTQNGGAMLAKLRRAMRDGATPEAAFAACVPRARRKRRGQFFTPPAVAAAMVRWVCARSPRTLLDPAVGPGIFLARLAESGNRTVERIVAMDTDPLALRVAQGRLDSCRFRCEWRQKDFLTAPFGARFDAIVCNPPYVRHHDAKLPEQVFRRFDQEHGVRISRLTNLYCLFLLRILSLLSERGRAAVITPTEFLNADFGRAIKTVLLRSGALRGFIIFDYRSEVFDTALTTATITLLDKQARRDDVTLVHLSDLDAVGDAHRWFAGDRRAPPLNGDVVLRRCPRAELRPACKWGTPRLHVLTLPQSRGLRPLGDFARCTRGIATGANFFFTLSRQEARQWGLRAAALRPCITKAAHAPSPDFSAEDYEALAVSKRKSLLFDACSGAVQRGGVSAYLRHGVSLGVHTRYLTRHRTPWYRAERRAPADIWVSVFGRRRLRFVRNSAGVLSLTAYHAIYLTPRLSQFTSYLMAYFYSTYFSLLGAAEHRVYGDGLLKFEPRDVERLLVPDLESVSGEDLEQGTALGRLVLAGRSCDLDAELQQRVDAFFDRGAAV